MPKFTIQVQSQFEIEALTLDEAMDAAVDQAMELAPEEWGTVVLIDENAALKTAPVLSVDCEAGDHVACEGEESAIWPDGTQSMRKCSCVCHTGGTRA